MKTYISIVGVLLFANILLSCQSKNEVNLTILLKEMVDKEQITRFPENGYKSL